MTACVNCAPSLLVSQSKIVITSVYTLTAMVIRGPNVLQCADSWTQNRTMVSPLLNFVYSDYVSDDGNTYSIRTDAGWAANTASGCTVTSAARRYGKDTAQRHRRYALYVDSTGNGRKRKLPVCTAAAATALVGGTAGQT